MNEDIGKTYINQFNTSCLSHYSYYIEHNKEAAVIDPMRDPNPYLQLAAKNNAKIKYVFNTHFNSDFVSGHLDIQKKTGAQVIFGPNAEANYDITIASDQEMFPLGNIFIKVIHTPGHTIESSCYLITKGKNSYHSLFTGDTLLVGDVGRPDLSLKGNMRERDLAIMLFDSLAKLKELPDDLLIYPAHTLGYPYSKNIKQNQTSSIGDEKKNNTFFKEKDLEIFIRNLVFEYPPMLAYYYYTSKINKEGYDDYDMLLEQSEIELDLPTFEKYMELEEVYTIDTRYPDSLMNGFIPGSINITSKVFFSIHVGMLFEAKTPFLIIAEPKKEKETISKLLRIGYYNIKGYLSGGIDTWINASKPVEKLNIIQGDDVVNYLYNDKYTILDVREYTEYQSGTVTNCISIPLSSLQSYIKNLSEDETYYLLCKIGIRSAIASTLLYRKGIKKGFVLQGGYLKIKEKGIKLV